MHKVFPENTLQSFQKLISMRLGEDHGRFDFYNIHIFSIGTHKNPQLLHPVGQVGSFIRLGIQILIGQFNAQEEALAPNITDDRDLLCILLSSAFK